MTIYAINSIQLKKILFLQNIKRKFFLERR